VPARASSLPAPRAPAHRAPPARHRSGTGVYTARVATSTLPPLLPEPRRAVRRPGRHRLRDDLPLVLGPHADDRDFAAACRLAEGLAERCGVRPPVETHARALDASTPHWALQRRGEDGEGYRLRVTAAGARLEADGVAGLRHGVETLLQLVDARGALPACEIEDAPDFAARGLLLDVSRGRVPTEAFLRETVELCARLKLNVLLLYLEHPFAFRRHPAIGAGSSPLEAGTLRALDRFAAERGVELVPCLQSLGHMERVLSLPPYAHLAETDAGWTLAPVDPGTPALLDDLYAELLPNFRSPRFHANCDEPWDLGRGRSAGREAELGPGGVYAEHLRCVHDLAARYGKRTLVWADVLHAHPERLDELPDDMTFLDWWYESEGTDAERLRPFSERGLRFWVCPGTSAWNALAPRLANALANIARFAEAGRRQGAEGLLVTDWGDFGHPNLPAGSLLPIAWAAQQAWSGDAAEARFDRAFSRLLYGDASGEAARLTRALGAVHDAGFELHNASPLQALFFDDLERGAFTAAARAGALRRCERRLTAVRGRLERARERFAARPLDAEELRHAADASLLAVRKAQAGLDLEVWRRSPTPWAAGRRRALARRLRELAEEQSALARQFRRLWRARARPSEQSIALQRFRTSVRGLRRAASRLERGRPWPPPPRPGRLGPHEVLAEVRHQMGRRAARETERTR